MNIQGLINLIKVSYKVNRPVLALSSPGAGKSSAIYQGAQQLSGIYETPFSVMELRAATANPSELADIKWILNGEVVDAPQKWFPTNASVVAGSRGIIFLDEILDGTLMTQSCLQRLLLDRKLGSLTLADGWWCVAASNRQSDKAAAGRASSALVNRGTTVGITVDNDEWGSWAIDNNINHACIGFSKWRPNCWAYDPKNQKENPAFCSPRSMHILSDLMSEAPNPPYEWITGTLGDGVGSEFAGFLRVMGKLPDLNAIERGLAVEVPRSMDVAIATLYALMARITPNNANNILSYFSRNETELAVTGIRDLTRMRPEAAASPAFRVWASDPRNTRLLTV